jgi:hypothetical protein
VPLAQPAHAHHQPRSGSRLGGTRLSRNRTGCPSGSHPLAAAEDGFEGRDAGAGYGDADLDHAPQVNQDAFLERVRGLGVAVDGVQAHHATDGGKGAGAENEEESDLFAVGPLDGPQRGNWKGEDPYVCDDVER